MTRRQRQNKGVAFLGAALVVTSLLAGCTGEPGQDITRSPVQVSEGGDSTSAGQVPEGGDSTSAGQVPEGGNSTSAGQVPKGDSTISAGQESEEDSTHPAEPVPPPSGGHVSETVPPVEVPEPVETDLVAEATPAEGIIVELRRIEAIEASAHAPGQIAGPALAVTVLIKNSSARALDTSGVAVSLEDVDGKPGPGMIDEPAKWFEGSIDPGAEAFGVYVFTVAESARDSVRVSVTVRPKLPAVVFTGAP